MRSLASFIVVLLCVASVKADITVTEWNLVTAVQTPTVLVTETAPPVILPFNVVSTVTDGESEASSTYDFGVEGDFGSFSFVFDHDRDGAPDSAATSGGNLSFSVPADSCRRLLYSLSGDYTVIGPNRMGLTVTLIDVGVGTVFHNQQVSENTVNQSFALGETKGDLLNNLIGDLTGSLMAGHGYQLNYDYFVRVGPDGDPGATAVGSLKLEITPCAATCAADLDGDGQVRVSDLIILLAAWGSCAE